MEFREERKWRGKVEVARGVEGSANEGVCDSPDGRRRVSGEAG